MFIILHLINQLLFLYILQVNKIHILIALSIFAEVGYSLLAPLYPFLAKEMYVSDSMIGVVFSIFAVSNFIFTFISPMLIRKFGREKLLYFAIVIEGSCTCFFGLLSFCNNYSTFIFFSFVLRLAQGAGGSVNQIIITSLTAANSSEEEIEQNFGLVELGFSVGLTAGPFIASVGYYLFGYTFPFVLAGCIELGLMYYIPYLEIKEDDQEEDNTQNMFSILTNKHILLTFLAPMIDMMSLSFIYPVLAPHLNSKFNLSPEMTSLFFIIESVTYFFALQWLNSLGKHIGNRLTITLGTFVNAVSVLLLAPYFCLPQSIYIIIVGLGGLGIAGAMVSIPAVVDLIKTMKEELHLKDQIAQDYSSAIFNLSYFIGETLGPLMGGILTQQYGFEKGCTINSQMSVIFGCIYGVWSIYTKQRKNPMLAHLVQSVDKIEEFNLIDNEDIKSSNLL